MGARRVVVAAVLAGIAVGVGLGVGASTSGGSGAPIRVGILHSETGSLALVVVLGALCFSALGVGLSGLIRSGEGSS
ncbi:MAG TPA: hypothetical protein VE261_00960, partial [Gaiellaceae bacterium]|nr:hypothetical protein [Gaiellaceae bacterium]